MTRRGSTTQRRRDGAGSLQHHLGLSRLRLLDRFRYAQGCMCFLVSDTVLLVFGSVFQERRNHIAGEVKIKIRVILDTKQGQVLHQLWVPFSSSACVRRHLRGSEQMYLRTAHGSSGAPISWAAVAGLVSRLTQNFFTCRKGRHCKH